MTEPRPPAVDARHGQGVQIGDHTTQHIHLPAGAGAGAVVTAVHADPGTGVFVGREPDLGRLAAFLAPGGTAGAGVVQGMGGSGKTALVRRAAAAAVERDWFPGGAVFADLRGYEPVAADRIRPGRVFAPVLRALGVPAEGIPSDAAQQPAAYHRHLDALAGQGRRVLVVLDNAADLDQVRDLLPTPMAARTHRVLITSRDAVPLPGADRVELGVLPPGEAAELLRAVLEQRVPGDPRPAAEAGAVAEVLRWCGFLPQAVVIAAGVLAGEPDLAAGELAEELADTRTRLDVLDDGSGGVLTAFLASWDRLRTHDPEAARLLCLLTIAPGPDIGLSAAAAVLGTDEAVARVRLRVLTRAHLLLGGPRRWEFHDLLRLAVTRHAVAALGLAEADLAAATDRVLGHHLDTTRAASDWLATVRSRVPPPADSRFAGWDEASAWLDAERACLVAAVAVAGETSRDRTAVDLAAALSGLLSWRRQVADWVGVAEVADRAVRRLRDRPATVRASENLGAALIEAGRFEEAVSALGTARLVGRVLLDDLASEARVCDDLGLALQGTADFAGAAGQHHHALELFRELGDRRGEAVALSHLGNVFRQWGEYSRAIRAQAAAAEVFAEIGDRAGEAMARGNLAMTLHRIGSSGAAVTEFLAVRAVFHELGDRHGEGQAWRNLGVVFRDVGRPGHASTAFFAAAERYAEAGDRRAEVRAWREVERLYREAGRPDDARLAAERAGAEGEDEPIRSLRGWRIRA
ncbi:AAA family ATPase [Amycolatopsis sp. cg9]|uniref:AAA family ATPase n=1 Tax=Amycolatopsis sp. cg9 TaxID=3238801 RepID=UPI00352666F6